MDLPTHWELCVCLVEPSFAFRAHYAGQEWEESMQMLYFRTHLGLALIEHTVNLIIHANGRNSNSDHTTLFLTLKCVMWGFFLSFLKAVAGGLIRIIVRLLLCCQCFWWAELWEAPFSSFLPVPPPHLVPTPPALTLHAPFYSHQETREWVRLTWLVTN